MTFNKNLFHNSEGKKDILSPFLLKVRKKFLSFGLFSLLLWFLCCHELIFWRVINLKYSTKSLQIWSKPLKRSLYSHSSLFVFQALCGSPVGRACLKRLSTAGSWPWLSYATHLLSSTAAKAAISRRLLWLLEASTLTFQCKTLRLTGSLFRRSAIAWGKGLPRLLPQYNSVCIWVLLLFLFFLYFKFLSQNVTPLMKTTLNYGLNFIIHVGCGREVRKEAHKVII